MNIKILNNPIRVDVLTIEEMLKKKGLYDNRGDVNTIIFRVIYSMGNGKDFLIITDAGTIHPMNINSPGWSTATFTLSTAKVTLEN